MSLIAIGAGRRRFCCSPIVPHACLVLALLPVLSGIIVGIAAVSLGFGFVHGITLGFGVTLIGEAVDYAIYLFTQTASGAAPAATLRQIGPTLRLGMLTSVCGFSAMLFSSFTGFAQLGLFTIVGLLVALAVTRFVLPALLPAQSPFRGATVFAVPLLALMRQARLPRFVVLALTLLAAIALVLHKGRYWENELASMSPLPAAQKSLDEQLRRETGAPDVRYFLVVAGRGSATGPGGQRSGRRPAADSGDRRHHLRLRLSRPLAAERGHAESPPGGIAGRQRHWRPIWRRRSRVPRFGRIALRRSWRMSRPHRGSRCCNDPIWMGPAWRSASTRCCCTVPRDGRHYCRCKGLSQPDALAATVAGLQATGFAVSRPED